jgi:predicted TIM-barrel fold metal-dependent hydrolase
MSTPTDWNIIDVHTHIRPPWLTRPFAVASGLTDKDEAKRNGWLRKLVDLDLLVRESAEADVGLRLLSTTIEGVFGTQGPTDLTLIRKINDYLAETQGRHPGRLAALATIDAFSGDEGAHEAERAVKELGHVGIVIDSSRDERLLGDPSVRPTLEAAAALKVPVLVHPVGAPNSEALTRGGGTAAYALGRGSVNGAAFLSILGTGLLDELPDLQLVFTAIGVGALVIAAAETEQYSADRPAARARPNVYFDIMGLNPPTIRYLVDFLGADRVVVGSDWPIWAPVSRRALARAFAEAGLKPHEQKAIAEGNARRLLNARTAGSPVAGAPAEDAAALAGTRGR